MEFSRTQPAPGRTARIWPVPDPGLGNSSYVAEVADGLALAVDPGRDPRPYLEAGYDNLAGELDGGMQAWQAAGLPVASIPLLEPGSFDVQNGSRMVLDVRQRAEWAAGHLPGAIHAELGNLAGPAVTGRLPGGPMAVMCEHGERSMTAASLLAAAGFTGLAVLRGGPATWARATGQPVEHG